jgi:hypothetical protein
VVAAATLLSTWSSTDNLVGGLGDGYFALHDGTSIELYNVSAPTTVVDTAAADLFRSQFNQNHQGDVWYIWHKIADATIQTVHVTQSGGSLTLDAVGGFSGSLAGNSRRVHVAADSSQLAWHDFGNNIARIIDTSNGSNPYSWDLDNGSHTTAHVVGALGNDCVLVHCVTHSAFEIIDVNAGSLVDDLALPTGMVGLNPYPYALAAADRYIVVGPKSGTNPIEYHVGTLSTSGGVLSWAAGPDLIAPGWGNNTTYAIVAAWRGVGASAPQTVGDASSANYSVLTVDAANARAFSANEAVLYPGVYDRQLAWVDADHFVAGLTYPNSSSVQQTWSLWGAPAEQLTAPRLLRQRQSPKRTPSRVSYRVA